MRFGAARFDGFDPATAGLSDSAPARPGDLPTNNGQPGDLSAPPIRDPHHYATLISLVSTVGLASLYVVGSPKGARNMLMFRNASASQNIYIDFGRDATTFSILKLAPGALVLFDTVVPQDDIYCIADAAGATLITGYSTIA